MRFACVLLNLVVLCAVQADLMGGDEFENFRRKDQKQFEEFKRSSSVQSQEQVAPATAKRDSKTDGEETPGIETAVEGGAEFFRTRRQAGDDEKVATTATIAHVRQLKGVKDVGLSEDDCTIWLEGVDGYSGIIIFKPMEEEASGDPAEIAGGREVRGAKTVLSKALSAPVGAKRAIVLEPFEDGNGGGDLKDGSPEQIVETMKEAGLAVTHVRGADAGIEQFARLGEYDIVYMHTHCGYKKGNTWMSGEKVTPEKTAEYRNKYGDAVIIGSTSSGQTTYAINADFIRRMKPFQGTFVYVSGCNSTTVVADQPSMATALKEKGAVAYMGYDGFMMKGYATANTDIAFFKYLIQHGLTVEEALRRKPSVRYGRAHSGLAFKGRLGFSGGGNVSIPMDKDKRIEILKNEHRRLQEELVELRDMIQANPSSGQVPKYEKRMDQIRTEQKEIYQRVLALQA